MTSESDKLTYPEFESAMQTAGGYQWEAVPVTNASGYNLVLFHLIGDSVGLDFMDTRGPVLLQSGIFSNATDWLERIDTLQPPISF